MHMVERLLSSKFSTNSNNAAKVNANYKYVEWINVQDDSADNGETFWHENGVKSYVVS